ncbi:MAG: hypothetical protein QOH71_481 [Blastocatellia bacterium]|jgi:hypothetical protein|nr:hypothetical protein [Blastocatellia bacterium]
MSQEFDVRLPLEESYRRRVLFAIELLDGVTLSRVSQGIKLIAEGLKGKPIVNASGMSVWLEEDFSKLQKISIEPGNLPYEKRELQPAEIKLRPNVTTIELRPRVDYSFAPGITGLRGTLIESRVDPATPVTNAAVYLQWLDDENNWRNAPTTSQTDQKRGDFVSILRLAPTEVPLLGNGEVTVRLRVSRDGGAERGSNDFKLSQGRITDPSTLNPLIFAWDELQP